MLKNGGHVVKPPGALHAELGPKWPDWWNHGRGRIVARVLGEGKCGPSSIMHAGTALCLNERPPLRSGEIVLLGQTRALVLVLARMAIDARSGRSQTRRPRTHTPPYLFDLYCTRCRPQATCLDSTGVAEELQ